MTVRQHSIAPTVTVTNAVPREYIYPDITNRQQNILTRSTPVCRTPIIAAAIQNPTAQAMGVPHAGITRPHNLVSQPWATSGTPGVPMYQLPTVTGHNQGDTVYPYGAAAGASETYIPLPRQPNSVRLHMADDVQMPRILAGNTEGTEHRAGENPQSSSDNGSEHGSNTSSSSRQELAEARKAFRHVLQAPNAERFTGDKKMYHLWKTSLQSEVEHIRMTSDMWLKLLQHRTKSAALEIVQENRRVQEIVGPA